MMTLSPKMLLLTGNDHKNYLLLLWEIQNATHFGNGDSIISGEDVGKFIPDRFKMFTVSAPRSIELDKVLPSGNVIVKCLVSQLVQCQLLNSWQLTHLSFSVLAAQHVNRQPRARAI